MTMEKGIAMTIFHSVQSLAGVLTPAEVLEV